MDQNLLVIGRLNAGSRLLGRLVQDRFEVDAAFWTRTEEEDFQLHIVNRDVAKDGLIKTYERLHEPLGQLPEVGFGFLELDLLGADDPAAIQVADLLARQPGRVGVDLGPRLLGERMIEWGYIYPEHFYHLPAEGSVISEDLWQNLYGLISRSPGSYPPSRIALRSGHSFDGVPIAFSMGVDQASVVQFRVDGEPIPRVVPAQEILAIR